MSAWDRRKFLRAAPYLLGLGGLGLPALGQQVHTVQRGDTLSHIARTYGVTVRDIMQANNLRSDLIRIGQRLIIPETHHYTRAAREATRQIEVERHRWKFIVAHHSAIRNGNAASYDRFHRRRGMPNGLAYHFVIGNGVDSGDGEIEIGPRWQQQLDGGHVRNPLYNRHGIGICLVGNFEETRPTRRQIASFNELVSYLGYEVLEGDFQFTAHKEVDRNHTVCPGRFFPLATMHRTYG